MCGGTTNISKSQNGGKEKSKEGEEKNPDLCVVVLQVNK